MPACRAASARELVEAGTQIIQQRRALIPILAQLAQAAYARIAPDQEEMTLEYVSSVKEDFMVELAQARSREEAFRSTLIGPHRDEVKLSLAGRTAAQYASEGQKRSVVIALKMAQAEHLSALHGSPPILLIDDVMGELDAVRRHGFLPLLQRAHQARSQVFMTATEENWSLDLGGGLRRWEVAQGALRARP